MTIAPPSARPAPLRLAQSRPAARDGVAPPVVAGWHRGGFYPYALAGIAIVGLLLRVVLLGHAPLWRDEAFAAALVGRSPADLLEVLTHDSSPPLAAALTDLVGFIAPGEGGLRLLPALAGTLTLFVAAALGRRCAGNAGGLGAAAWWAVSPTAVGTSRDARMYALAGGLCLLALLTLLRAVERPTRGRIAMHALAVGLALHTHYFAAFAVLAGAVGIFMSARRSRRGAFAGLVGTVVGMVTLIPWLAFAGPSQLGHANTPFWAARLTAATLADAVGQLLSGPLGEATIPAPPWIASVRAACGISLLIVAAGAALVALSSAGRRRKSPFSAREVTSGAATARYLAVSGGGGLLLLMAAGLTRPVVEARYATVVWGPIAILLGVAAGVLLRSWKTAAVGAAPLVAAACMSVSLIAAPQHPDSRAAIFHINAGIGPKDVVTSSAGQYLLVRYYGNNRTRAATQITASEVAWYWGTAAYPRNAVVPTIPETVQHDHGSVWVIGPPALHPPQMPVGYIARARRCWPGVCVERWGASPGEQPTAR